MQIIPITATQLIAVIAHNGGSSGSSGGSVGTVVGGTVGSVEGCVVGSVGIGSSLGSTRLNSRPQWSQLPLLKPSC
jgi:hypothetical protein